MLFSKKKKDEWFNPAEYHPSLMKAIKEGGLSFDNISVAIPVDAARRLIARNRNEIMILDREKKMCEWKAPPISELFRTDKTPPSLEQYPPEYVTIFAFIETHICTLCAAAGDRRDKEMEEIYTAMKKRPDGKSLGPIHDIVWQLAAVVLALRPISRMEYEAVFARMAHSASKFAMGAGSRNYVEYLRQTVGNV